MRKTKLARLDVVKRAEASPLIIRIVCAALLMLGLSTHGALAAQASPAVVDDVVGSVQMRLMPVFGTIHGADSSSIVIRSDEGKYYTLFISGPPSITRSRAGTRGDIKAGGTLVSASQADAKGTQTTSEVIILSGLSDAVSPGTVSPVWFKGPVNAVESGTVTSVSTSAQSATIQISAPTGQKTIAAPASASITVIEAAALADLNRGIRVRALCTPGTDGTLVAKLVEIGS